MMLDKEPSGFLGQSDQTFPRCQNGPGGNILIFYMGPPCAASRVDGVDDDGRPVGILNQIAQPVLGGVAQIHRKYGISVVGSKSVEIRPQVFAEKYEAFSPRKVFHAVYGISYGSHGSPHEPPVAFLLLFGR